jgi:transcriptional regulator with XRE-family HTH domain
MELFGKRVKSLRTEQAITQRQAAKEFGVTEVTWQRYEAGYTPSFRNCVALADYFNVSLDYLIGRSAHRTRY